MHERDFVKNWAKQKKTIRNFCRACHFVRILSALCGRGTSTLFLLELVTIQLLAAMYYLN